VTLASKGHLSGAGDRVGFDKIESLQRHRKAQSFQPAAIKVRMKDTQTREQDPRQREGLGW